MSSLVMAITSYTLVLWFRRHQARCSDYGQGPVRGAGPLPMSGYRPENIWKRPLCTPLLTGFGGASLAEPHRLGQSFQLPNSM